MSSMDDELRRMIDETPLTQEARIERARQNELMEAMDSAHADALADNKQFDRHAAELAHEQHKHDRRWYRRAVYAGGAVIASAGLITGGYFLVQTGNNEVHAASLRNAATGQLTSVEELRKNGACADELLAERDYNLKVAELANNSVYKKRVLSTAGRFGVAAVLAQKYSVSCLPAGPASVNLTPDFDVAGLESEHACADELLAKQVDLSQAPNSLYKDTLELKNTALKLNADLAQKYHVAC